MRIKTVTLDPATKETLLRSRIEGCNLFLPGQLERTEYQRVAKAIEAAGGKWNRKAGCHVFSADVRETLNISEATVDVVNVQQTFQSFYTPKDVANRVIELADIEPKAHRILEPSAGTGNLLLAIHEATPLSQWPYLKIVAVEINPKLVKKLTEYTDDVHCADFLQCNGEFGTFDRIVMNPPFTDRADIKHIQHALRLLNPGGRLVSICADGPRQREALDSIADQWIELEPGSFAESGTNVNTAMIVINK